MHTWIFSVVVENTMNLSLEEIGEKLYGGRCDDTLISETNGEIEIEFCREGASLHEVVQTAIEDIEAAQIGLQQTKVKNHENIE